MTATDKLRVLLDERGVKWVTSGTDVCWTSADGYPMRAWDTTDHKHMRVADLTPAQAIAATLGRGTCEMVVDNHHRVDKVTTSWGCVCSACGWFHQYTHGDGWAYCPSCGAKVVRE